MREMKLYTKTGDTGKTSLIGGRVDKDSLRVETYGAMRIVYMVKNTLHPMQACVV